MVETAAEKAAREKREAEAAAKKLDDLQNSLKRSKRTYIRTCVNDRAAFMVLEEQAPTPENAGVMQAHLESWKEALCQVFEIDEQLMKFIDQGLPSKDIEKAENEIAQDYDTYKFEYNKCVGKLKAIREGLTPGTPTGGSSRRSMFSSSFLDATLINPMVKIQDVPVPLFDGKFSSFPDWYAEFSSIVDKNESFDNFQKLYLLKRSMGTGAAHILKDLGNDGKLYRSTFQHLYDTYFNRRRIIAEHFSSLIDMPFIKNTELRDGVNQVQRILRGLSVCDINVETMSPLIAFIVSRKISDKLRLDWDNSNHDYSVYPSFESLSSFLLNRSFAYETNALSNDSAKSNSSSGNKSYGNSKGGKSSAPEKKSTFVAQSSVPEKRMPFVNKSSSSSDPSQNKGTCIACQQRHYLDQCNVFLEKSVNDRFNFVKGNRLCVKCLKLNHSVANCKRSGCAKCNGNHHSLLHRESNIPNNGSNSTLNETVVDGVKNVTVNNADNGSPTFNVKQSGNVSKVFSFACSKVVILSTAVVKVQGMHGTTMGRVLMDPGSETSLITREFCDRARLKITKGDQTTMLIGISDNAVHLNSFVKCVLKSRLSDFSIAIEAEVINKIPYKVNRTDLRETINDLPFEFAENFELPYDGIDILLGSQYVEFVLSERRHFIEGMCLRESYFGFVASGSLTKSSSFLAQRVSYCGLTNSDLCEQFRKFVSADEIPDAKKESLAEYDLIEDHFQRTYSICDKTNRFVIRLPLKPSVIDLKGSFSKCRAMLQKGERRRSDVVQRAYIDLFNEYLELGHMTKISNVPKESSYFLPHHMVKKVNDAGISFRIVFNASAIDESGSSLNDHFLQGPVLQPTLFSNVVRFREHLVAFCSDISRMYRRILIHLSDRMYQQILFRFEFDVPIDIYELNTLTNGIGPASYLATRCLLEISKFMSSNSLVSESIRRDFYMDNYMSGSSSLRKALELLCKVHEALYRYGFPLCKYQSNSKELLAKLDESLIDKRNVRSLGGEEFVVLLGLLWFTDTDTLGVNLRFDTLPAVITKRVMLSDISRIFDVLGILSPVTVRAKLILQELWKEGRMWDEEVSNELASEFFKVREDLALLSSYVIDRCYYSSSSVLAKDLIGFCDASTKAYCVVVYIRSLYEDGHIDVSFVCSKSRVAPIKTANIHRLELTAAELLSKLISQICEDIKVDNIFCFADSQVVLSWLNFDVLKLKQFVSNRVSNILKVTKLNWWFYVKGTENPADLGTRGISAELFLKSQLWKQGPPWLSSVEEFNSRTSCPYVVSAKDLPEIKTEKVVNTTFSISHPILSIVSRKSSLYKCISIVAFVLRYVRNLKSRIVNRGRKVTVLPTNMAVQNVESLSVSERNDALDCLLHVVQVSCYSEEYSRLSINQAIDKSSKLLSLNVFLDSKGLMRVKGRTVGSCFSFDTKFPLVIPAKARFLELLIEDTHRKYFHASISFIINFIRSKYWVVGNLLSIVKKLLRRCIVCVRINAECCQQIMGDLPKERVSVSRPFSNVGVDLTGAINLKCTNHRSIKSYKVYLAFFVCFSTRAVHIEVLEDLTSEAFLNCLERFVARRGCPRLIYSDNGTNFVGARNILLQGKVDRFLVDNGIEWKMIAPRSPHQGGIWEAAVKSGKAYILKAIGEQRLTLFELLTIATKVESILNSRPISYKYENSFVCPLTPNHFLIGSNVFEIPVEESSEMKLRSRYFLWKRIVESFWQSWRHSYFNQLRVMSKWKTRMNSLKVDDVVIVVNKGDSMFSWPLAIVHKVFPDANGIVRNVEVRLSNGSIRRMSIQNLILIPCEE